MEREPEEMSPEDITLEMVLKTFLVEAEENLSKMEELLITLETEPENDELFHTIFRMAHTLKGMRQASASSRQPSRLTSSKIFFSG